MIVAKELGVTLLVLAEDLILNIFSCDAVSQVYWSLKEGVGSFLVVWDCQTFA